MELGERARVRAAKQGDKLAIRELIGAHERAVFALLHRMLRPASLERDVDDLAQETFLKFFRALDRFDESREASVASYLLTIAARVALDRLKARREALLESDSRLLALEDPAGDLDRQLTSGTFERALSSLTDEHRAMLLMREVHDMEYQAIAVAVGIEVGTVRSRLARAREAFRKAMIELGEEVP